MTPDELRKLADDVCTSARPNWQSSAKMLDAADAWEAERAQATLTLRAYNTARTDMMDLRKRLEAAGDVAYDEMYVRNVDRETMNAVRAKIAALAGDIK